MYCNVLTLNLALSQLTRFYSDFYALAKHIASRIMQVSGIGHWGVEPKMEIPEIVKDFLLHSNRVYTFTQFCVKYCLNTQHHPQNPCLRGCCGGREVC